MSRLGDVWLLGKHRLVCGDSTDADCVAKALGSVRPHLMVTDPPYGVEYDPAWRIKGKADGKLQQRGGGGKNAIGAVSNDDRADWREAWALFPGAVAYVWCAALHSDTVIVSLESCGLIRRSSIIWRKTHFAISRGDYHWQHEPCWYAVRKGSTGHWQGDRTQSSVWEIDSGIGYKTKKDGQDKHLSHSTQKPVECMKRPIENNSSPGQAVYDPFVGSGTTIIAAEMTGRACHAIEISPAYVDVAVKRWQNFAGQTATLEASGARFDG
jgi:DNA modification methylase